MIINKILRKACLYEYKSLLSLAAIKDNDEFERFYNFFNQFLVSNNNPIVDQHEFKNWFYLNKSILDKTNIDSYSLSLNTDGTLQGLTYNALNKFIIHLKNKFGIYNDLNKDDLNLVQESILQKTENIPNLFIIEYNLKNTYSSDAWSKYLDKENSFLGPVLKALNYQFGFNDILSFISNNKKTLEQIRHQCYKRPEFLGSGADGSAFDIGGAKILKFFQNKNAFEHAAKSMKRLHKTPELGKNEPMIYDVGVISDDDRQVYYYIMERMPTVMSAQPYSIKSIYSDMRIDIENYYRNNYEKLNMNLIQEKIESNPQIVKKFLEEQSLILEKILNNKYKYSSNLHSFKEHNKLSDGWLKDFIQEFLFKLLTNRDDLHSGNVGTTNYGKLKFFDPVYD